MRSLQWHLSPRAEHVLDWFHVAMRVQRLRQFLVGLISAAFQFVEGDVERVLGKIGLHVMLDFSGKSGGFRVRVEFDPTSRNFGFLTVETFVGTLQGVLVACRQVTDPGIVRLQYFIEHGEAQKADILALFKDS